MEGWAHVHTLLPGDWIISVSCGSSLVRMSLPTFTPNSIVAIRQTCCFSFTGGLLIFDLGRRSLRPVATIVQGDGRRAATCLAFNCRNPNLLAVGNTNGTVGVWHLSSDLTEQSTKEISQLEQIANQVAEWDRGPWFDFYVKYVL